MKKIKPGTYHIHSDLEGDIDEAVIEIKSNGYSYMRYRMRSAMGETVLKKWINSTDFMTESILNNWFSDPDPKCKLKIKKLTKKDLFLLML